MENLKQTNNLNVNIPKLLSEKYPRWMEDFPEIYQLNEDLIPIKEWKSKKEIISYYGTRVQGLDLALRNSCRFKGYYWIAKILYDVEGIRPVKTIKRNNAIYAYNPCEEMLKKYYNYEDLDRNSFFKEGIRETFQFIGRFSNSIRISEILDVSITNIRRVAKCDPNIIFHKDYYFSFVPLMRIHEVEAEIIELSSFNNRGVLSDSEKKQLFDYIEEFKSLYFKEKRVLGFLEQELWELINSNKFK